MKKKNKTIDDIVYESKMDIYTYIIITIVLFLILLYFSFKVDWYFLMFCNSIMIIVTITKVFVYIRTLKIRKYLITNHLTSKIGNIDYWNNNHYLLTENYMIVSTLNRVNCFPYSEIKEIYKKSKNHIGKNSYFQEYLCLVLENWEEIEILIFSTALVNEDYKDITDYLLNKNANIKISYN